MTRKKTSADWDARYGETAGGLFGDAPNNYLRMLAALPDFKPRTALLPADGDGRNGTWLATRGIEVTAFDLSGVAVNLATRRDARTGVSAERFAADVMEWQPQPGRTWDAALIFYLHGPAALRRTAIGKSVAALSPGGWLALEAFAKTDAPGAGPADAGMRYDPAELEDWTAGLDIVELMTGKVMLDEGARHQGLAHVVRMLARKPG